MGIYLAFVAVGALVLYRVLSAARRRRAVRAVADGMGWTYTEHAPGHADAYGHLPMFRRGRQSPPSNVLRGGFEGRRAEVFDHTYSTTRNGSGRVSQTVVHLEAPELALPQFALEPLLARPGGGRFQEVALPRRRTFECRYYLHGPDAEAVRAWFADHVLDHFEATHGLSVEAAGPHLFVYRADRLAKPDALPDLLAQAAGVLRAFEAVAVSPPPIPGGRAAPPPLPAAP